MKINTKSIIIILILTLFINLSLGNNDNSNSLDQDNNHNKRDHHSRYYNNDDNEDDEIEVVVKVKIPTKHKDYDHNYVELDDIDDEKCNRCKYYNSNEEDNQKTTEVNKHGHSNHYRNHRDKCGCLLGYYGKECRKREFNYQRMFIDWSNQFNRTYTANNFYKSYESFKENSRFITSYNKKNETTMTLSLTKYADLTLEDYQNEHLSILNITEIDDSLFTPPPSETPSPNLCNAEIEQTIINSWVSGQTDNYIQVQVTIKNKELSPITQLNFYCEAQQIWEVSTIGTNKYGLPSWVSSIPVNGSLSFGYIMKSSVLIDLQQVECKYESNNNISNPKPSLLKSTSTLLYSRPASIDWRTWGFVTSVKNQGSCGSCYTFSALGALESHYYRKYNKELDLSEQNLVDCTSKYGNGGCSGGWMHNCFKYINENGGINLEKTYPYTGQVGPCRYSSNDAQARIIKHVMVPQHDENALADAVATVGPVSVAYDASTREFMLYGGGIYDSPSCDKYRTTHAVVVIGYGTENGIDYWTIKNSWGPNWGERGYFRMRRNTGDRCGIVTASSYPVLA